MCTTLNWKQKHWHIRQKYIDALPLSVNILLQSVFSHLKWSIMLSTGEPYRFPHWGSCTWDNGGSTACCCLRAIVCAFVKHPVAVASCVHAGLPTECPQVSPYPQKGINRQTLDIYCIQTASFTFREISVLCISVCGNRGVIFMWNVKVCLIVTPQEQATNTMDVSCPIFEVRLTFPVNLFFKVFLRHTRSLPSAFFG